MMQLFFFFNRRVEVKGSGGQMFWRQGCTNVPNPDPLVVCFLSANLQRLAEMSRLRRRAEAELLVSSLIHQSPMNAAAAPPRHAPPREAAVPIYFTSH